MSDHRILVIANRTCPCPALADAVAERADDGPSAVLVVAPALNKRLRHWVSDVDAAIAAAHQRLERAVANLTERGITARGVIGDTEIVVATHPPSHSNWLEKDLPARASERFGLPVTHLISEFGLQEAPSA